ncbi:glycerophosphodiester phosphodiesterase family protein [Planktomarina temperata]|nr:glycerophosphodiester phosphodiesterase family protein [Planktomarina temperata]
MHLIHRGILNKSYKENNLKSFKASFKKGYGVETDIHATKDNKFICFHDFSLKKTFKINKSIKSLNYTDLKNISKNNKTEIPLLKDLLILSKTKQYLFIEIKPLFSKELLKKLLKETNKFKKCVFISFKEKNIYDLLKIKKATNVGLSFSSNIGVKTIIKKSKNKNVNYLILDKYFINNKKIQKIKKNKYFYTIKNKKEFFKYSKKNNLIFENL